jgi:hypothetical protein
LFADVINQGNVWRANRGGGPRIFEKPRAQLRVVSRGCRKKIYNGAAAQPCIFCEVDFTASAFTELFQDLVMGKYLRDNLTLNLGYSGMTTLIIDASFFNDPRPAEKKSLKSKIKGRKTA